MTPYEKLQNCLACVRAKTAFVPDVALILGSGLGALAASGENLANIKVASGRALPNCCNLPL